MTADLVPKHLRLPYALTKLECLVSASEAIRNEPHFCPNCRGPVTLRRGDVRVAHFAHRSDTNCQTESAIHKIAKRLVAEAINANAMSDDQIITIERDCEHCGLPAAQELPPGTFTSAGEEEFIGKYCVDAVGYRGTDVALGIEIRNTHAVEEEKARTLEIPWIELDAQKVIDNPFWWSALASRLKTALCTPCKKKARSTKELVERWKIPEGIYSVVFNPERAKFIAGTDKCWKCKEVVPVFWWEGVPFAEDEPPSPRPSTIQYRYSKQYGGKYWVNTCARCKSTLGDNFIFLFDNAPLKSPRLPLRRINRMGGTVSVETGPTAVNSFMKAVFGKYR